MSNDPRHRSGKHKNQTLRISGVTDELRDRLYEHAASRGGFAPWARDVLERALTREDALISQSGTTTPVDAAFTFDSIEADPFSDAALERAWQAAVAGLEKDGHDVAALIASAAQLWGGEV